MELQIINNEELEYVANVEDDTISLRYSKSDIWTNHTKGTYIGKLKDTGNKIKIDINGKKIKLDYDEFEELLIMMNIKQERDKEEFDKVNLMWT